MLLRAGPSPTGSKSRSGRVPHDFPQVGKRTWRQRNRTAAIRRLLSTGLAGSNLLYRFNPNINQRRKRSRDDVGNSRVHVDGATS